MFGCSLDRSVISQPHPPNPGYTTMFMPSVLRKWFPFAESRHSRESQFRRLPMAFFSFRSRASGCHRVEFHPRRTYASRIEFETGHAVDHMMDVPDLLILTHATDLSTFPAQICHPFTFPSLPWESRVAPFAATTSIASLAIYPRLRPCGSAQAVTSASSPAISCSSCCKSDSIASSGRGGS